MNNFLTSLLKREWPQAPMQMGAALFAQWQQPRFCLGISFGRQTINLAEVELRAAQPHIARVEHQSLAQPLFQGQASPAQRASLVQGLKDFCTKDNRHFSAIQIALPDPAVWFQVFELEELPKSIKARRDLVRWRFTQDFHLEGKAIAVDCQYLGNEENKHLLLGLAVDAPWLAWLKAACREAGLLVSVIDMAACHVLNRFHSIVNLGQGDGAWVSLETDYWSLGLLDAQGRPRFLRTRWRDTGVPDYKEIAAELEQTIRAYSYGRPGRSVDRLYITGEQADAEGLMAVLDARVKEKCRVLPWDQGYLFKDTSVVKNKKISGAALAAASYR